MNFHVLIAISVDESKKQIVKSKFNYKASEIHMLVSTIKEKVSLQKLSNQMVVCVMRSSNRWTENYKV